jgi:hypothetical protein
MPAVAAQTFKCMTADAVRSDKGRFVRDNVTQWWSVNGYKTIVVDTRSGAIKLGDGPVSDWVIQQNKVDGDWDFVASSADARITRVAADLFRLRDKAIERGNQRKVVDAQNSA